MPMDSHDGASRTVNAGFFPFWEVHQDLIPGIPVRFCQRMYPGMFRKIAGFLGLIFYVLDVYINHCDNGYIRITCEVTL